LPKCQWPTCPSDDVAVMRIPRRGVGRRARAAMAPPPCRKTWQKAACPTRRVQKRHARGGKVSDSTSAAVVLAAEVVSRPRV